MSILLPLYVYPWPDVWNPLYYAAGNHTNVNFTVILNPCSGPCVNSTPETPYLQEIPKLKSYSNIRTLGYVATNYSKKPLDDVLSEVWTYGNWTKTLNEPKMAVEGIFFDEIPGVYDWTVDNYLKRARDEVKACAGLGEKLVVHNPGAVPDAYSNFLARADITVILEDTFMNWLDQAKYNTLRSYATTAGVSKNNLAVMMHTLPNIAENVMEWVVGELRVAVGWLFVTSVGVTGEWWHSFSTVFEELVDATAAEKVI